MGKGAPTKCTEEITAKVELAARMGVTMRRLHEHAGVDRATIKRWMAAGEDHPKWGDFCARVKAARAECEVRQLSSVHRAGRSGSWQASAWLLERSYGYRREEDRADEGGPDAGKSLDDLLMEAGPDALRRALAKLTGD